MYMIPEINDILNIARDEGLLVKLDSHDRILISNTDRECVVMVAVREDNKEVYNFRIPPQQFASICQDIYRRLQNDGYISDKFLPHMRDDYPRYSGKSLYRIDEGKTKDDNPISPLNLMKYPKDISPENNFRYCVIYI